MQCSTDSLHTIVSNALSGAHRLRSMFWLYTKQCKHPITKRLMCKRFIVYFIIVYYILSPLLHIPLAPGSPYFIVRNPLSPHMNIPCLPLLNDCPQFTNSTVWFLCMYTYRVALFKDAGLVRTSSSFHGITILNWNVWRPTCSFYQYLSVSISCSPGVHIFSGI